MKTQKYLNVLVSYKELFGVDKTLEHARELISGMNSATIIYKLAHINLYMYLSQPGSEAKNMQFEMLKSFLKYSSKDFTQRFQKAINDIEAKGQWPAVFWEHSTLLFFDLIFENYIEGSVQMLSNEQTENILKAYLIINSVTNNRFTITGDEIRQAIDQDKLEDVLLPQFLYQRDYDSNLDFSNQINRGIALFQYLENSSEYSGYVGDYYKSLSISDYKGLFYNILTVWSQAGISGSVGDRRAQISLSTLINFVNLEFVKTLIINDHLKDYNANKSFTLIREYPLFQIGPTEYIILDINFLTDHLYRTQIFKFKTFLSDNSYRGNFLSVKGKEFMEDIYFRDLMSRCFRSFTNLDGDHARKENAAELSDYYARKGNKLLLIEFKDIMLNADIKDNADRNAIDSELNKKFATNQSKSPKGITQLYNAVKYLENADVLNDKLDRTVTTEVFPVIVYTDRSFGHDGINKKFKFQFRKLLAHDNWVNLQMNDIVFINLNYFELHEQYISGDIIDIFDLLKEYTTYVELSENSLTRFELFSRAYFNKHDVENIEINPLLKSNLALIIPSENSEASSDLIKL